MKQKKNLLLGVTLAILSNEKKNCNSQNRQKEKKRLLTQPQQSKWNKIPLKKTNDDIESFTHKTIF